MDNNLIKDQNTIANQAQTENIVKRILSSEVKYTLGIIIFLVGVVAPFYDIKTEVALIKQNHLMHIENMQKQIEKMEIEQTRLSDMQVRLMETIAERLPKKGE